MVNLVVYAIYLANMFRGRYAEADRYCFVSDLHRIKKNET
jgi:hypothetical protein